MGEFARIDRLRRTLREHGAPVAPERVPVGIGDDAAVLTAGAPLAVSVDAQEQGVHFHPDWLSREALAHRALAAALSDLPAMGAEPEAALVSLVLPPALDEADFDALGRGFARASRRFGVPIVGGNLSGGDRLGIHTTVFGRLPPRTRCPLRSGARPGDALLAVGTLGAAALGLLALRLERQGDPLLRPFVEAWRLPEPPLEAARIAREAHAAIDVSDGLLADLNRLCEASGVGCVLRLERLPLHPDHVAAAEALGIDPLTPPLHGGEDYALLLAWPPDAPVPPGAHVLGDFAPWAPDEPRLHAQEADGTLRPLEPTGWEH